MTSGTGDDSCQMKGCTNPAEHTMTFERHDDVAVCAGHYRRNVALKYGLLVGISVVLAALGLGLYWFVV